MAAISIKEGGKLTDLRVLFNSIDEVYFSKTTLTNAQAINALSEIDLELPILDSGVTFDSGTPDKTEVKLTTGAVWVAKLKKGDSDISMQVASVAGAVNDLFLSKKGGAITMTNTIGGKTYKGEGYGLEPKSVDGALVLCSEDKQTILVLPSVTLTSNFVGPDDSNPAYFNVAVTPRENEEGMAICILEQSV